MQLTRATSTRLFLTPLFLAAAMLQASSALSAPAKGKPGFAETNQKLPEILTQEPTPVYQGKNFFVNLGGTVSPPGRFLALQGFRGAVGWQGRYLSLDFRVNIGSTPYSVLYTRESPSDLTDTRDSKFHPDSEFNRYRVHGDMWKYQYYEPGVGVSGKLFSNYFGSYLPRLSERGRFGYGWGPFTDSKNGLIFSSQLLTFEAALQYQLGQKSPFAVDLAATAVSGVIQNKRFLTQNMNRLPVSWMTLTASLFIWF